MMMNHIRNQFRRKIYHQQSLCIFFSWIIAKFLHLPAFMRSNVFLERSVLLQEDIKRIRDEMEKKKLHSIISQSKDWNKICCKPAERMFAMPITLLLLIWKDKDSAKKESEINEMCSHLFFLLAWQPIEGGHVTRHRRFISPSWFELVFLLVIPIIPLINMSQMHVVSR